MRLLRHVLLASVFGVGATPTAETMQSATESPSVLSGVFTEDQAIQGQALYYERCLMCHGESMEGLDQSPPLAGPQFTDVWNGEPLLALAERITSMPPDKPDSLSMEESVNLLTYILWFNNLPVGDRPLGHEPSALAQMTFETPPPGP